MRCGLILIDLVIKIKYIVSTNLAKNTKGDLFLFPSINLVAVDFLMSYQLDFIAKLDVKVWF